MRLQSLILTNWIILIISAFSLVSCEQYDFAGIGFESHGVPWKDGRFYSATGSMERVPEGRGTWRRKGKTLYDGDWKKGIENEQPLLH